MTLTQKKWLKWAVIGFILGTIAVLAYRYLQPKKAAPTYITATAEQADIENSVMATGKVEALNQVDVGAQVSGEVTKLYVEVGQTVKKGDIIVKLDGQKVSGKDDLVDKLQYYEAGETIEVVISRANSGEYKEQTVEVTLGSKPSSDK